MLQCLLRHGPHEQRIASLHIVPADTTHTLTYLTFCCDILVHATLQITHFLVPAYCCCLEELMFITPIEDIDIVFLVQGHTDINNQTVNLPICF